MAKRILALLSVLTMVFGLCAGCGTGGAGALKVRYTLSDEEKLTKFFMDREYALDADSAKITEAEMEKAEAFLAEHVLEAAKSGDSAFDIKIGDTQIA